MEWVQSDRKLMAMALMLGVGGCGAASSAVPTSEITAAVNTTSVGNLHHFKFQFSKFPAGTALHTFDEVAPVQSNSSYSASQSCGVDADSEIKVKVEAYGCWDSEDSNVCDAGLGTGLHLIGSNEALVQTGPGGNHLRVNLVIALGDAHADTATLDTVVVAGSRPYFTLFPWTDNIDPVADDSCTPGTACDMTFHFEATDDDDDEEATLRCYWTVLSGTPQITSPKFLNSGTRTYPNGNSNTQCDFSFYVVDSTPIKIIAIVADAHGLIDAVEIFTGDGRGVVFGHRLDGRVLSMMNTNGGDYSGRADTLLLQWNEDSVPVLSLTVDRSYSPTWATPGTESPAQHPDWTREVRGVTAYTFNQYIEWSADVATYYQLLRLDFGDGTIERNWYNLGHSSSAARGFDSTVDVETGSAKPQPAVGSAVFDAGNLVTTTDTSQHYVYSRGATVTLSSGTNLGHATRVLIMATTLGGAQYEGRIISNDATSVTFVLPPNLALSSTIGSYPYSTSEEYQVLVMGDMNRISSWSTAGFLVIAGDGITSVSGMDTNRAITIKGSGFQTGGGEKVCVVDSTGAEFGVNGGACTTGLTHTGVDSSTQIVVTVPTELDQDFYTVRLYHTAAWNDDGLGTPAISVPVVYESDQPVELNVP